MISDMSNASLRTAINTSLLKKSMDTNEALMAKLIDGLSSGSMQTSQAVATDSAPIKTSTLDIYA
ncbi:putative motility protein [Campylobacter upsaliensis]|nr:putative motility protein [Campylobacter upsaliensis]